MSYIDEPYDPRSLLPAFEDQRKLRGDDNYLEWRDHTKQWLALHDALGFVTGAEVRPDVDIPADLAERIGHWMRPELHFRTKTAQHRLENWIRRQSLARDAVYETLSPELKTRHNYDLQDLKAQEFWQMLDRSYKPTGHALARECMRQFTNCDYSDHFADGPRAFANKLYQPVRTLALLDEGYKIHFWMYETRFIDNVAKIHGGKIFIAYLIDNGFRQYPLKELKELEP